MLLIDEFVKYADRGLDGNGKQKFTIFLDLGSIFFILDMELEMTYV